MLHTILEVLVTHNLLYGCEGDIQFGKFYFGKNHIRKINKSEQYTKFIEYGLYSL